VTQLTNTLITKLWLLLLLMVIALSCICITSSIRTVNSITAADRVVALLPLTHAPI